MTAGDEMVVILLNELTQEVGAFIAQPLLRGVVCGHRLPRFDHRPLLVEEAPHHVEVVGHHAGTRVGLGLSGCRRNSHR